jgi:hypothetical protein
MNRYVATLRAVFDADDDVTAIFMADQMKVNAEQDFDESDNAEVEITQVTSTAIDLNPEETFQVLRRARNLLIKSRIKECFEQARALDQLIYILQHRHEPELALAGYDYGKFMDVVESILINGEVPRE